MRKIILIKFIICVSLLAAWILFRLFYLKKHSYTWDHKYTYSDLVLDSIYGYSIIISQNLFIRDYMLILCSTGLDFFLILFLFIYLNKGSDYRPIKNIVYFYIGRLLLNVKYEEQINPTLYNYPGFPSIVMSYDIHYERYISTYTGLMTIFMFYFYKQGFYKIFYFSFLFTIYLILSLILLRASFSIDIIIGFILGHLTYILSDSKNVEKKKKNVVITRRISKLENNSKDTKIDFTTGI